MCLLIRTPYFVVNIPLQSYVSSGKEQLDNYVAANPINTETTLGSITATVHSATSAALGTTGQYLASAHKQLQPQADSIKPDLEAAAGAAHQQANVAVGYGAAAEEKAQPHVDAATTSAKQHLANAQSNVPPHVGAPKDSLETTTASTTKTEPSMIV